MNLKLMLLSGAGIIALGLFGTGAYFINKLTEQSEIAGTYAMVAENNAREFQEYKQITNTVLSSYGDNMSVLNQRVQINRKTFYERVREYDEVDLNEMAKDNPDAVTKLLNDEYERLRLDLQKATSSARPPGSPEVAATTEARGNINTPARLGNDSD